MGKYMRKLVAALVAAAMILTSGIGVFAAGSPELGQVSNINSTGNYSSKTMGIKFDAVKGADSYDIYVNGVKVQNVKSTSATLTGMVGNATYDIQVQAVKGTKTGAKSVLASQTLSKRWFKNIKVKKVKKGKKKATVTWKKVKGATGYQILYSKDGKTWKTKFVKGGKKTKAVIKKLSKGKWYFKVRAVKGDYLGIRSKAKTAKIK